MTAFLKFMSGGAGTLIIALLVGMGLGAWCSGGISDALQGKGYRETAQTLAKVSLVNVQSAGRREMNYIRIGAADRAQAVETVETMRGMARLSIEAQAKANARADKMISDFKAHSDEEARVAAKMRNGDASVQQWLDGLVPDAYVGMRVDPTKECQPDYFSGAGYPSPPGDKCTVAKPPR